MRHGTNGTHPLGVHPVSTRCPPGVHPAHPVRKAGTPPRKSRGNPPRPLASRHVEARNHPPKQSPRGRRESRSEINYSIPIPSSSSGGYLHGRRSKQNIPSAVVLPNLCDPPFSCDGGDCRLPTPIFEHKMSRCCLDECARMEETNPGTDLIATCMPRWGPGEIRRGLWPPGM